ncbi:class D sortase [Bacillus taeanensis]|nr:class D sortase [Bacillus taeanensis]
MRKLGYLFIMIGIAILLSNGYAWWDQAQAVTYDPDKIQQQHEDWKEITAKKTINPIVSEKETVKTEEIKTYQTGKHVGKLAIPRIGSAYDVYWGADPNTLKKGVGMYESKWTVSPNQKGHVVLSGHRDTVFRNLKDMNKGDHLYFTYEETTYNYQVRKIWITDKDDRSVIVKKSTPTLTLTTCYPFDYLGSAPDRYIIQAELISKE